MCVLALGATDKKGELFTIPQEVRACLVAANYAGQDENIQVNGFVLIIDMTGFGAKHLTHWTIDDLRKWNSCWQASFYMQLLTYLDLVPPVLSRTLGDELPTSGTIVGSISRITPVNTQCVQIFFQCALPCPPWSSDPPPAIFWYPFIIMKIVQKVQNKTHSN